jgi:hypothetical protein
VTPSGLTLYQGVAEPGDLVLPVFTEPPIDVCRVPDEDPPDHRVVSPRSQPSGAMASSRVVER